MEFVELRCFEMAQIALRFDKVDVCGRPMNVGRPKGYIERPELETIVRKMWWIPWSSLAGV